MTNLIGVVKSTQFLDRLKVFPLDEEGNRFFYVCVPRHGPASFSPTFNVESSDGSTHYLDHMIKQHVLPLLYVHRSRGEVPLSPIDLCELRDLGEQVTEQTGKPFYPIGVAVETQLPLPAPGAFQFTCSLYQINPAKPVGDISLRAPVPRYQLNMLAKGSINYAFRDWMMTGHQDFAFQGREVGFENLLHEFETRARK